MIYSDFVELRKQSVTRIARKSGDVPRDLVDHYIAKTSSFIPYTAHEFYRALGGNNENVDVIDFATTAVLAWDLFDWICDHDIPRQEVPTAARISNRYRVVSKELARDLGPGALMAYESGVEEYKLGTLLEKTSRASRETSIDVLEKKSSAMAAILVPSSIASKTALSMERIGGFSRDLYCLHEMNEQLRKGPKDSHDVGHFLSEDEMVGLEKELRARTRAFLMEIGAQTFLRDVGEYLFKEWDRMGRIREQQN